jgi:hypothetical protein
MRIRKEILTTLAALASALIVSLPAAGQASSLNTFSPYTMYGIGDLNTPGTSDILSMGGAGSALRPAGANRINYLNPASYSNSRRYSFLINFGMAGGGYYLKNETATSSFNTFNINNVSVQFPLASRLGAGVSVTPLSSVGYRVSTSETDRSIIDELGMTKYNYSGEGGISQLKTGLGFAITKRLSIGAEMIYYLGNIDRSFDVIHSSFTGEISNNVESWETNRVSRFYGQFGVQYNAVMTDTRLLTLAASYQPGGALDPKTERMIPAGGIYVGDTVAYSSRVASFEMPDIATVGFALQTPKAALVADYTWQGWGRNEKSDLVRSAISYRNTNSFKIGGEYTPNWMDVRNFMNRITYRAGVRLSDYYMNINGHKVTEKAVTFGMGVPLRMAGMSSANFGLEIGQRGSVKPGLIRENYLKFTIGLNLFGEDYWFVKPKFD